MKADPRLLPVLAAVGFAGCAVGLLIDARTMWTSYLAVWVAVSAIPIGALGVLFTTYLVRAGWTRDLHAPLIGAALTTPFAAILFIPVVAGIGSIYPWVSDPGSLPAFKAAYLTPWFFVLRTLIYFSIWSALAVWAWRAYGNDAAMARAASAGLIAWALCSSFAGIDWLESIEPHFHSSIYGLFAIDFHLLAGLAFGLTALLTLRESRQMSNASYSGVMLSLMLLWVYMHAMQYIIIWAGNIPEEATWYIERLGGGWGFVLWGMFAGQFIVPFFALLSARVRSSTRALLALAVMTLAMRVVEAAVLVLPPTGPLNVALVLDIPAAILAIGAAWLMAWRATGPLLQRWLGRAAAAG